MKKKKLLYLSQVYPYPADGGGKIKTLNSLTTLAKEYEIYAVFISEKKPTIDEINFLKKLGIKKIKVFFNSAILASVKDNYLHLFKNFLKLTPHYVFQYTHRPAFAFVQRVITHFKPDIIHIDHINIAQYLPKEKNEVWILEHHNLEFYLLWTRFIHSKKWSRKLYLLIESTLTYLFESTVIQKFDHIFTISEEEKIRTKQFFKIKNVTTQPLVYPLVTIKKEKTVKPYILFIGNLGWPPNEDAIEWFINSMWPKVLNEIPNAEFHIVGKNNPLLTKRLPNHEQFFLHGYQENILPFLKKATIFVLPFRMGGGVRIKSLTALSVGIPLVSTKLGVEGLQLRDQKEYLEAKSETEFATKVCKLLASSQLRKKMSLSQIQYLKTNHSERKNIKWLNKYEHIISSFD